MLQPENPMTRDPRVDPRPGDVLRIRNKTRTVTSVGTCVGGRKRICYKQVTVKGLSCYEDRFVKAVSDAEVIHAAD